MLTVVFANDKFRSFLVRSPIVVLYIDHFALRHSLTKKMSSLNLLYRFYYYKSLIVNGEWKPI